MSVAETKRPLTDAEFKLARYMLQQGGADNAKFLNQLDQAEVTPWRCKCGCASLDFEIKGISKPEPGMVTLGDFLFGEPDNLAGIFIYECGGVLSGIEVYGLPGDAPRVLPQVEELSPLSYSARK